MKKLWDISPLVSSASPLFPGDTVYQQRFAATIGPGCPVNVSVLTLSPHVGAHADAPKHYDDTGQTAAELDLTPYLGPCRVIHAIGCGPLIRIEHVQHAAADLPPRVLVRCCPKAREVWHPDFTAYAPETVAWLAARGVQLIGIDTPSVDPADSKSLDSHHQLRDLKLRVLENLILDEVPEGDYELIALPLKLADADASPVRAVLREL